MGLQEEEEEVKGLESPTVTGRRGGRGRVVSVSKYHSIFNTTYVSTEINPDQDYSGNFIKDIVDNIVSTSVLSSLRKRAATHIMIELLGHPTSWSTAAPHCRADVLGPLCYSLAGCCPGEK